MMSRVRWFWVLIGWTLFLWLSRLRNVVNNDELSTTGQISRIGVVVVFVVLAGFAAFGRVKGFRRPVRVLLVWTVGYWLVRGIGILIDGDYSIGFKAVHTVLMVVSLALAGLTVQELRRA